MVLLVGVPEGVQGLFNGGIGDVLDPLFLEVGLNLLDDLLGLIDAVRLIALRILL